MPFADFLAQLVKKRLAGEPLPADAKNFALRGTLRHEN